MSKKQTNYSLLKRKDIVFLTTGLDYGGAETQIFRICQKLNERGWKIKIISMLPPKAYKNELMHLGIYVVSLGMRRGIPNPIALLKIIKILLNTKPIILVCFLYHATLLGRLAGKITNVPIIISSFRNMIFGGKIREKIMKITDFMSTISTINSRRAAEFLVEKSIVPRNRIIVIPNGIDVQKFQKIGLLEKNINNLDINYFSWLTISRLEPQKDLFNLIRAFYTLTKFSAKNQKLSIIGKGPLLNELKKLTIELKINDRVKFIGITRNVFKYIREADGFVLSSAWEGLPNVLIEAHLLGKPIVATNVGGIPEIVQDNISGFLVPPRDTQKLADAMLKLSNLSREERIKMGKQGREHIIKNFDLEKIVDKWENLFISLSENILRN
ncbi:MAG: glycosyltransferase [Promethearchaeota archaeon]